MEFGKFVRECYLRSNPSVDLDKVTKENPIKCSDHKLGEKIFEELVGQYAETEREKIACYMWCLQSGPSIVRA